MQRKFLAGFTATLTAVSLVLTPCITVFAEDAPAQEASEHINAKDGEVVTHEGDITATDGVNAIHAEGEGTQVNETGNVSVSGTTQGASGITGAPAIVAESGAAVNVTGNTSASDGGEGVNAKGSDTKVNVGGDINVTGQQTAKTQSSESAKGGTGIQVEPGADVTVGGNINVTDGGYGINAYGKDTKVTVNGDTNVSGNGTYKTETRDGATTGTGVNVGSGAEASVKGDVVAKDGSMGVSAYGEGTKVSVGGNVDASGSYKYTDNNVEKYGGSLGVNVTESASVDVTGNVVGGSTGVSATSGATTTVGGSVTSVGVDSTYYTWNEETQKYDIPHNSVSGTGITTDGDASITVKGDVNGVTNGILVNPNNDDSGKTIVVAGTISSARQGQGIQISTAPADQGGQVYDSVEDYMKDVPTLVVGAINSYVPVYANGSIKDLDQNEARKQLTKAVRDSINYIISVDQDSKDKYGVSVSGDNVKEIAGYQTVNIEKAFQVAAKIPEGYQLEGGENVKVTQNSDGTYTLTLTNSKGGINVKAVLIPVNNPSTGETEYQVVAESTTTTTSAPPAGAIVATSTAAPAAGGNGGTTSPISGDKPARSVVMDLSKVTPVQYQAAVIQNVAYAPANGAFNIETDRVTFLDRSMIEAIAARPDIDVNVVFMYGGRKIKVRIPAGYNVRSLLDSNGYCGFLRLLSLLGEADAK